MESTLQQLVSRYPVLHECLPQIRATYELLRDCFRRGGKLLVAGNGGSAADAEHIVGELMKGFTRRRSLPDALIAQFITSCGPDGEKLARGLEATLPAISLVSQSSLISATVNDGEPELVFAQQVLGYAKPGDVLLAISTSGNSRNIVYALQTARTLGAKTIGLTGAGGGAMNVWCDVTIRCPATDTPLIQELHLPVYHALCTMLEDAFFPEAV